MPMSTLKQLLLVHKEKVALIGVALFFIFLVVGGLYLQKNREKEEILPEQNPDQVTFVPPESTTVTQFGAKQKSGTSEKQNIGTYFLKPTPDDLLHQLSTMENLNPEVVEAKYVQMPVLWKVYFFSFEKGESIGRVVCDVSEDGFGVSVESTIANNQFPEIETFAQGDVLWLGGKITAVDPTGTGTIYLETEYLSVKNPAPQEKQ